MSTLLSGPTAGVRRPRAVLSFLLLLTLATATAGCKTDQTTDSAKPDASQGLSNVDPTASQSGSGSGATGSPATTKPSAAKPSTTKPAPAGPHIEVFGTVSNPGCGSPGGPGFNAVPGSVKLSWKVTGGATMVGLSIDDTTNFANTGHGSWQDYPAVGSDTLPFVCNGAKGNKTHKYTVDTIDGGAHVSKTITLTAYWPGA